MKIIPLGTSSGKPTLARNVSAVAIVGEGEWWLFDCGEGTQHQMARAGLSFHRLAGIFITHLHGDHFNGLAGLLSTMGMDRRQRELVLIGPPGVREYLDTLARLKILFVSFPLEVREVSGAVFAEGRKLSAGAEIVDDGLAPIYESARHRVLARPLNHRIFTLGYRIEEKTRPGRFDLERARALGIPAGPLYGRLQSGESVQVDDGRIIHPADVLGPPRPGKVVAYCTDTRPCAGAVALAREADWVIHEATYTEEHAEEADDYGHSTASQAARIAREAGAQRLLITHISSRYPDAAPLLKEARAAFPATTLAEELMELEV
jgi:ribonuclease Z